MRRGDLTTLHNKAEAGDAEALFNLGWMYANGVGVPKDEAKAVKLLCQAAGQGCAAASYLLGDMYVNDKVVPEDDAEDREIRRLALKPFSKRNPHAAIGANRKVLFAMYQHRVRCGAYRDPRLFLPAREKFTKNRENYMDDQWPDNHGLYI